MTTTDSRQNRTADARRHRAERDAPLDAAFDALSDRTCRALLGQLAERDEAVVVPDLAARLASGDADAKESGADAPDAERRLCARLHHTLLPKLDDAGLVDYDADRGLVRYRPDSRFAAVASAVESFEAAASDVSIDALCELFADYRRRTAYLTLVSHDDLSLPDLADEVAVAERERPLTEIDPDDVLEIYLSLYHTHVPKLAAAGLVDYDQEADYVALTDDGLAFESPVRELCEPTEN
ncbi:MULTISPECIES: hypothetical protein [Halorussus]|uniref:DUF7344 domain-containing protein n=1 Tax=Halorussus TaxID=1070314 RepID=UPI000E20DF11|nr:MULTISPECIES: hypothetical protein [Halorussus]NHN59429.1 hypothetical protein [Halorussus sp. JP-T4]